MCTPFRWASLGSALSWGPWGTDAHNSTVAMPWLRSRSKKVAEMVMESHWVPRKKQSQEHREEEMEGRAGRCWRMDGWTGQSQDGTPGYRTGGVLLTDVTTEGAAPGRGRQGPGLLTCLCHSGWRPGQGWPSPGVGNSCFGLCWWRGRCSVGKKGKSCITETQSGHKSSFLLPFLP